MRKMSSCYSVYYKYLDENKQVIVEYNNTACYRGLFDINNDIKTEILILYNFKCEETIDYYEKFIEKLCKTFNFKYKLKDDELVLTNLQNILHLKTFVTIFRTLFECYDNNYKTNTIEFVKLFSQNEIKDRRLFINLIKCYNKSNIYQGPAHGLKSYGKKDLIIKTKKEFKSSTETKVHGFFKQIK